MNGTTRWTTLLLCAAGLAQWELGCDDVGGSVDGDADELEGECGADVVNALVGTTSVPYPSDDADSYDLHGDCEIGSNDRPDVAVLFEAPSEGFYAFHARLVGDHQDGGISGPAIGVYDGACTASLVDCNSGYYPSELNWDRGGTAAAYLGAGQTVTVVLEPDSSNHRDSTLEIQRRDCPGADLQVNDALEFEAGVLIVHTECIEARYQQIVRFVAPSAATYRIRAELNGLYSQWEFPQVFFIDGESCLGEPSSCHGPRALGDAFVEVDRMLEAGQVVLIAANVERATGTTLKVTQVE